MNFAPQQQLQAIAHLTEAADRLHNHTSELRNHRTMRYPYAVPQNQLLHDVENGIDTVYAVGAGEYFTPLRQRNYNDLMNNYRAEAALHIRTRRSPAASAQR